MQVKNFQEKILTYYSKEGRDLPWRKTRDPYPIMLSEIMLQQTQVSRVVDYWTRWLKKWPTIQDLAQADRRDVLAMWSGLGYNNRAVRLHKAAQLIMSSYHGDVLAAMKDYKNVPGIGPYTSAAVQIFSGNKDLVTVDTNIRRILLHEFELPEHTTDKELWGLAKDCLPKGRSRDWHNALMDYGATHLTSRKSGIRPKTRQSKFEGSDRQIRARILRHMVTFDDGQSFEEVVELIGEKDTERLKRILEGMIKDDLISLAQNRYVLKE